MLRLYHRGGTGSQEKVRKIDRVSLALFFLLSLRVLLLPNPHFDNYWSPAEHWAARGVVLVLGIATWASFALEPAAYQRKRSALLFAVRASGALLPYGRPGNLQVPARAGAVGVVRDVLQVIGGIGVSRLVLGPLLLPLPGALSLALETLHLWRASSRRSRCALCDTQLLGAYAPAISTLHSFMEQLCLPGWGSLAAGGAAVPGPALQRQQCMAALTLVYTAAVLAWNAALPKLEAPLAPQASAAEGGWLIKEVLTLRDHVRSEWRHNVFLRVCGWYLALGLAYIFALASARPQTC